MVGTRSHGMWNNAHVSHNGYYIGSNTVVQKKSDSRKLWTTHNSQDLVRDVVTTISAYNAPKTEQTPRLLTFAVFTRRLWNARTNLITIRAVCTMTSRHAADTVCRRARVELDPNIEWLPNDHQQTRLLKLRYKRAH